jgi:CBS domain-containing protein
VGGDPFEPLRDALRVAGDVRKVAAVADAARALAGRLAEEGADPIATARRLTAAGDLVTSRLIELTGAASALAAAGACWIALGSAGREEQTPATDQDNALVIAGAAPMPEVRRGLVAACERVNAALHECGYPLCRGGVMAGNPDCCLGVDEWRAHFASWIERPEPRALLDASIFFDLRAVHGPHAPAAALRTWIAAHAREHAPFLLLMAENALGNAPPLGVLRDFAVARGGDHPGTIDLKVNGVQLFVEPARVYALASGSSATHTLERLAQAAARYVIGAADLDAWRDAFAFIQRLRLRLNAAQRQRGQPVHNHLDPATLERDERRRLKAALSQARALQQRMRRDLALQGGAFGA